MDDRNKVVYDLKKGKFGEYRTVFDYPDFESEKYISEEELEKREKFFSINIFVKDLLGNRNKYAFWDCLSNFNVAFNKEEVQKHFDNRIEELEDELELWKQYREMQLKKADEVFVKFSYLKQSTNYFDYL